MKAYIQLLVQEPVLRRLSLIQLIAYFAAWFTNVAIFTLLLSLNVPASVIAITAALHFLPGVLQAPFSGAIIDRVDPKKLMITLMLIEAATTLMMLLVSDISMLWLLYLLLFIRMGAASFYFTAEMSLLPRFLASKKLQQANEIHSIIWSFSYTVGMALSGLLVYYAGVKAAFVLDSALFLIGAFLLSGIVVNLPHKVHTASIAAMMRETFAYLSNEPRIIHLMILHAIIGLTSFDALVALMVDAFYSPFVAVPLAIGLLHALRAVGLVIGPIFFSKRVNNRTLHYLLFFEAFTIALWALVMENFYLSLAASVLVGLATTTLWSYTYTLIQHHAQEAYYGRVVAYNDMLFLLSSTLTSVLIGYMAETGFTLPAVAGVLGGGFAIAGLYFLWIRSRYKLKEIE